MTHAAIWVSKPATELSFTRAFPTFLLLCSLSDEPHCGRDRFAALSHFEVAGKLACSLRSLESLHWVPCKLRKQFFFDRYPELRVSSRSRVCKPALSATLEFILRKSEISIDLFSGGGLRHVPVPLGFSLGDRYNPADKQSKGHREERRGVVRKDCRTKTQHL